MNAADAPLVCVVDDDEAMRDSLRWLLESAGYRAALYPSAERFLACNRASGAACLVLDVRMNGMTGLELQQALNRNGRALPIIFVTGHGDVPMAVDALKNGAFHFLEKPFDDAQLLTLIEQAATGEPARDEAHRCRTAARLSTLTQREREVLDLVVNGRKNKQIAEELGISIKTVEAHRAHAMTKMGVTTVAELVHASLSAKSGR